MVFGFVEILSLSSSFGGALIRDGALVRLHLPLALAMADLLLCSWAAFLGTIPGVYWSRV